MTEPIAAPMAYRLDKKKGEEKILVYGLTGGTLDVSNLNIDNDVLHRLITYLTQTK